MPTSCISSNLCFSIIPCISFLFYNTSISLKCTILLNKRKSIVYYRWLSFTLITIALPAMQISNLIQKNIYVKFKIYIFLFLWLQCISFFIVFYFGIYIYINNIIPDENCLYNNFNRILYKLHSNEYHINIFNKNKTLKHFRYLKNIKSTIFKLTYFVTVS